MYDCVAIAYTSISMNELWLRVFYWGTEQKPFIFLFAHSKWETKAVGLKFHFGFNFNITSCLLCAFWSCECNTSFSFKWRYHHGFWRAFGTTSGKGKPKIIWTARKANCTLKWKFEMYVEQWMSVSVNGGKDRVRVKNWVHGNRKKAWKRRKMRDRVRMWMLVCWGQANTVLLTFGKHYLHIYGSYHKHSGWR